MEASIMKVEKIDHIVIRVRNMREACKFFSELFGLQFAEIGEIQEMDARSSIEPLGVEIIEPLTADGTTAKALEQLGEGFLLLCFKVSNLDEAVQEMQSRGIRQVGQVAREKVRAALFHPKDTYGIMIELVEYADKHGLVTSL
jgi:methylmalonyl-CoA/ethylmalonyl-CoA epimerase